MSLYSTLEAEQFRLLHLAPSQSSDEVICTLRPYSLQGAPAYTALSYTWSDPQPASPGVIPVVVVNDAAVRIGSNLASALLQLRRSGHTTVWADAICINQDDLSERSFQVSLMSRIYRQASDVFVWLGRAISGPDVERDLTNVAFGFLHDILEIESVSPQDTDLLLPRIAKYCLEVRLSSSYQNVLSAWRALLDLEYWRRAWILQEVCLNDDVNIFWGERSLGWRNFKDVFTHIAMNQQYQPLEDFVRDVGHADGSSHVAFERLRVLETLSGHRQRGLQYNLAIARTTKQTDPRDALYAKLGLSDDGNRMVPKPDYTASTGKVYSSFARSFIETKQSLYVICMSYPGMTELELPSWVPDWSHAAPRKQLVSEIRPDSYELCFRATAGSEPEVAFGSDDKRLWVTGFLYQNIPESRYTNLGMLPLPSDTTIRKTFESFIRASIAAHYLQHDIYDAYDLMDGMVERIAETAAWLRHDPSSLSTTCGPEYQQAMQRFEAWFDGIRNLELGRFTLVQWLEMYASRHRIVPHYWWEGLTPTARTDLIERFTLSATIMGRGRRIVLLPNMSVASVPVESMPDDKVCLLLGCPVPVVIRAVGDSYVVVGECYVEGIMHGEAMWGLLQGAYERCTFCIA